MGTYIFGGIGLTLLGLIVFGSIKAPRLTSVIWWALFATMLFTAALLLVLPGAFGEKALWFAMLVPLIWGGFQFWCYWDANKWRVLSGLIALSLVSGVIVFLSEPVI
ncbi:MAG: hypothetical protein AAFX02_09425 [Pseudomonadota bacterium]